jgi:lipopolysaccharide assembly outer membrane protein LptD (OstA)
LINSRLYLQKLFFVVGIFILFCGIIDVNAVVVSQNDSILGYSDAAVVDSLPIGTDLLVDSLSTPADSVLADSVAEPKKEMLEAEVQYQARDSIVFLMDGTGFLYGDGKVKYMQAKPIELQAEYIRFKLDSSTIYAIGAVDSLGNSVGDPVFSDGGQSYESKYMSYNFKTKKAYVRRVITQQDEGHIIADQTKMFEDQSFFMKGGKYTTCDQHDHPHFYLQLTKAKLKPGSHLAAGPAYLVLADVPLPLAVPFGFFPMTKKYASGIIMPQFGEELERGLFLKNGGYYWAINDYVDLEILGEYYTKGTWAVNLASQYRLRYKFSGSFTLS